MKPQFSEQSVDSGSPHPRSGQCISLVAKDIEYLESIVQNWRGRIEQISAGPLSASIRVVAGDSVRAVSITANRRIRARGHDTSGRISIYPITTENADSLWHGHQLPPGQIVVHGVDGDADHCSSRTSVLNGLSVLPEQIEDAGRVFLDDETIAIPHGWSVREVDPGKTARLIHWLSRILAHGYSLSKQVGLPLPPEMEQECLRAMAAVLFAEPSVRPVCSMLARSQIVDRAEEYMRSRLDNPIGSLDLCREVGVSDRTLRLAFRERFGVGPMTYYRVIRLNAVRARLRSERDLPIAQAAQSFGFRHLGHFAADYSRLFGELPGKSRA